MIDLTFYRNTVLVFFLTSIVCIVLPFNIIFGQRSWWLNKSVKALVVAVFGIKFDLFKL